MLEPREGKLVVVRPDGVVGAVAPLGKTGYEELRSYFHAIVTPFGGEDKGAEVDSKTALTVGEISLEGQEEVSISGSSAEL